MALTDLFTKFNGRHGAAPRVSHRHVDGRPRHAAGDARVPDSIRRGAGDVSGRSGTVRLLHRGRCRGGSDHRCDVPRPASTPAGRPRGWPRCWASRRTTPRRAGNWRASRSRSAAGRGRSPLRGCARDLSRTSAARRWPAADAVEPRRHERAHPATGSTRRSACISDRLDRHWSRRKAADLDIRNPMRPVQRTGALRRPDRAAGADDARHRRPVRPDSSSSRRSEPRRGRGRARASLLVQRVYRIAGHCGFSVRRAGACVRRSGALGPRRRTAGR